MARGKIVLVPFPFDDMSTTKVRPALALTDEIGPHRHVIVAFLTSQTVTDPQPTDYRFSPAHPDFPLTGLRGTGTVRLHRLMTATATVIRRELGELSPSLWAEVETRLRLLFGV